MSIKIENLSYTYPHWLYDFCTYLIYSIGGFKGVYIITCVLSAILGISIFLVNSKLTKSKSISFIITMGVIYALKPYIAARAQLVTFILFIWELFFIEKFISVLGPTILTLSVFSINSFSGFILSFKSS